MIDRWLAICGSGAGPERAAVLWHALAALYAYPSRAYHTLDHVAACLREFDAVRSLALDPVAVEFALYFHDCIYVAGRKDNEHNSGVIAEVFLACFRAPSDDSRLISRVRELIDATKHTGAALSGDAALIVDIDLAILGAPKPEYDRYAAAIRSEFAHVPDADYRAGRAAFLQGMLDRPRIFTLEEFHRRMDAPARENMLRERSSLVAGT